ncbi:hypothetical protein M514_03787 [Trichuris suis]|uniref:Uncharacterized protein n=1 Tax=Trichuris suis TaxID=68888 RepID=A0A085MZN1_9BILA|nr:hypothetical protein M514_03787 [Trichuris suis]
MNEKDVSCPGCKASKVPMQDCNLYTSSNATWQDSFADAAMQCINGVWRDVKTSNGMLLSLIGCLCSFDPKPLYAELEYNPIEVDIDQSIIDTLKLDHKAQPYRNDRMAIGNYALLFLILGKRIDQTSYTAWAQARIKAVFAMACLKLEIEDLEQAINFNWATNISTIYRYSPTARASVLEFFLSKRGKLAFYMCERFWPYARLKGFHFIQTYLIRSCYRPILADPYLSTDMEHWAAAMRAWEKFPLNKRVYAGLICNDDVFHLLAGNQLQRLTYIAVQVGALKKPHLKNYKCKAPPDKEACDALVEKYFSPNVKFPDDLLTTTEIELEFSQRPGKDHYMGLSQLRLVAIEKLESSLPKEDLEVRKYLAKVKFVSNLILEMERLTPCLPMWPQPSDAELPTSQVKEEQTESHVRSTQSDSEKCADEITMPATPSSQQSANENET